jgi:acyl-CoA reductase-like NAD-dependent aldehyde dehydrogenase
MSDSVKGLYIGGSWVPGAGEQLLDVVNPATEQVIGQVPQGGPADAVAAVTAARAAFDEGPWPRMSPRQRSRVLMRMADELDRRRPELIELSMREAGATRAIAETVQVGIPLLHFRDTVDRALMGFPFEEPMLPFVGDGIGQGVVLREPMGVAALIIPFNAPLNLNLGKLAPALAAGCTAVLKPSPYTPLEAFVLGEIADEAGLPPGVLNIITGDAETGGELTTHPGVDIVSFTGSDTVGSKVYAQAAPGLKKVLLELGGKSANIVCEDADLDRVAETVVLSATLHAGQACALLTRTLVHRSRHDELVSRVAAALDRVTVGNPADPDTVMGPLIRAAARDRVEELIAVGVAEGATLAYGGDRPAGLDRGYFLRPTLFTDVRNSMRIAQREFFGPVGVVIPFEDDEQAVRLANQSDYGLGGAVWAKDPSRAYRIARRLRTGTVAVNQGYNLSPYGAFGGYKRSGLGREWGSYGISEYLQHKTVGWTVGSG